MIVNRPKGEGIASAATEEGGLLFKSNNVKGLRDKSLVLIRPKEVRILSETAVLESDGIQCFDLKQIVRLRYFLVG